MLLYGRYRKCYRGYVIFIVHGNSSLLRHHPKTKPTSQHHTEQAEHFCDSCFIRIFIIFYVNIYCQIEFGFYATMYIHIV